MDQSLQFKYRNGSKEESSRIIAIFKTTGGGTIAHLAIRVITIDGKKNRVVQEFVIDTVLDSQFHMILQGLTTDQADALDENLLRADPSANIGRKVMPKLVGGTVERKRTIEIGGLAFGVVFNALASAVPSLAPLVADIAKIKNPIWREAHEQSNPFFGSAAHRAQEVGGKAGTAFECEKLTLWIANEGTNPEFGIWFKDGKDTRPNRQTAHQKALGFARDFPANQGGGTMYVGPNGTIFTHFSPSLRHPGALQGQTYLELVIGELYKHELLSAEEAERLASHQSIMGQRGRRIDMSNFVGLMQANRLRASL
ncbi:MAG: hypothetical protein EYC62_00320 [Alphaproteobacteria bacterium]|nr:MAG: hypothetical protein EYC62_00320 [Alphaproteobacteria bacterium]